MMTGKDGAGQIVKAPLTGLTDIALPLRLSVIMPLFGNLWTVAMGALYAIGPAHVADGGETFGVVHQRLHINHGASIAYYLDSFNPPGRLKWAERARDGSTPWNPY